MKKKLIFLSIMGLALVGCSQESKNDTGLPVSAINNPEANTHSKESHLELKGTQEIAIFERAVMESEKVQGIVNVTNPMYTFSVDEEFYFLWITEEAGSIMNRKDDHTIYTLSSSSVEEILSYINKE